MNDTLHAPTTTLEESTRVEAYVADLGSQALAWVRDHPITALAIAGAVGAALGTLAVPAASPSVPDEQGKRTPRDADAPREGYFEAQHDPAGLGRPDADTPYSVAFRTVLSGVAAVAAASLRKWSAQSALAEPDPVADLTDTDQFAQAPEAPAESTSDTAPATAG